MEEIKFGIDLDKPIIKNMDDYTTYLTALESAGRSLPKPDEIDTKLYQYREIANSSNVDPRYVEVEKVIQPKMSFSKEKLLTAFKANLNHNLRADLRKIKEVGGYSTQDLHKYDVLLTAIKSHVKINANADLAFKQAITDQLSAVTKNIKIMDDPRFDDTISKVVEKLSVNFFSSII